MSFVIGCAYQGQIIIKSDGRVIDETETKIIEENYNKTRKVSPSIICGYAGTQGLCELILNHFSRIPSTYNADDFIVALQTCAIDALRKFPDYKASFVVGGRNREGIATLNSFQSDSVRRIAYSRASGDSAAITALDPPNNSGIGIQLFKRNLNITGDIDSALNLCVKNMASRSFSVNSTIFTQTLLI